METCSAPDGEILKVPGSTTALPQFPQNVAPGSAGNPQPVQFRMVVGRAQPI